jgi:tetratricopeptide (TPR) repeat protein
VLSLRSFVSSAIVCLLVTSAAIAQKSKVQLESNETIFTVITAMNACGYNEDLANSEPVRNEVRAAVDDIVRKSSAAADAKQEMCAFYDEHKQGEPGRDLSQYVSLALNMGAAPDFKLKGKEADLPPDSTYVLGFVPLAAKFYSSANLHKIWNEVQPRYDGIIEKVNEPLANMILSTDVYLKNPISGYLGREFVIYLEPMAGPGQINARNYAENYFLVASPVKGSLPMDQIRHTYLHFILDPMVLKRPAAMKRLEPVLKDIQTAPLDESYKHDATLLVTESLIRAIEARSIPGKNAEPRRQSEVADDMADGFVLTRYFYDSLVKFEQEPTSLKDAFPDWLYYMDVARLHKVASETQFASKARGEVVKSASKQQKSSDPLDIAEQKISDHDLDAAEKLAQPVAEAKGADSPRAEFLLGEIATLHRDRENAIKYFEDTLRTAKEPRLIAWSHIYLARIYDVDQERDMAVKHYQAALQAGDDSPQVQAAAKRGLESPYERKSSSEQEKQ